MVEIALALAPLPWLVKISEILPLLTTIDMIVFPLSSICLTNFQQRNLTAEAKFIDDELYSTFHL